MEETWRDIEGYEGLYQISDLCNVKSLNYSRSGKEKILKPHYDKYGYLEVVLYKDGKQKHMKVHRLAAMAFIPNPDGKPYIDHINTIPDDNRLENLRWCTPEENSNNTTTRKNHTEARKNKWKDQEYKKYMSEAHMIPVLQCDKTTGEVIKEWPGAPEAEKELGIKKTNICACCNNKPHNHTAGGYRWRYKEKGVA